MPRRKEVFLSHGLSRSIRFSVDLYPFLGRPCVSCVVSCVESWLSAARSEAEVISHLAMDFSYVAC